MPRFARMRLTLLASIVCSLSTLHQASAQVRPPKPGDGTCDMADIAAVAAQIDNQCCQAGSGMCTGIPTTCTAKCGANLLPIMDECGDMVSAMFNGLDTLAAECRASHFETAASCLDDESESNQIACIAAHLDTLASTVAGGAAGGGGGGGSTSPTTGAADLQQLRHQTESNRQQIDTMTELLQQFLQSGVGAVTPTPTGDPPPPPPAGGGGQTAGAGGAELAGQVSQHGQSIRDMQARLDSLSQTVNPWATISYLNVPLPGP